MSAGEDPYARVRAACLAQDSATERMSHGEAAWFAKNGRQFATAADRHHDARRALWIAAPAGAQEALVEGDPARFFRPPYVGHRGWLGVRLDGDPDWAEIAELCEDAYRVVAPRTLVAKLDAAG